MPIPNATTASSSYANTWFVAHIAVLLATLAVVLLRYAPPPPQPAEAASSTFSAERAVATLDKLILPGVSHCVGSADHARVRGAIVAEFRRLGLEPEIQRTFAVNPKNQGADLENIIVTLPGELDHGALLLATHYDSVPAGPGAADDGTGVVGILEIARILLHDTTPRNDIILLLSDAEELGLIGAIGFAEQHPLISQVRAVLNWEARGSRGPSFMFETGPNNLGLIRLMARHCRRSFSTSLFPAVYDQLPNDSDLSVFKERGIAGLNFAFIGGLPHYHTRLDNLQNLDLGSLQHQGEHFLTLARVLSRTNLDELDRGDAVYFDVVGWFTFWWPQRWNFVMAMLLACASLLFVITTMQRDRISLGQICLTLLFVPAALSLAVVCGEGARWLVTSLTGEPAPWMTWPQPMCVALWCLGLGVPLIGWTVLSQRLSVEMTTVVAVCWWSVIGLLCAWYLPGGSYLFTVPVAAAISGRLLVGLLAIRWEFANILFLVAACLLWWPVARGLVDAVGVGITMGQTIPLALFGTLIAPTMDVNRRCNLSSVTVIFGGSTCLAIVGAAIVPAYSAKWPQPISIVHYEDADNGDAWLAVHARRGRIPDALKREADHRGQDRLPILFHRQSSDVEISKTGAAGLSPPRLDVQSNDEKAGRRRLRLLIRPGAGQQRVVVMLDAGSDVKDVTANGWPLEEIHEPLGFTVAAETGVEFELTAAGPIELTVAGVQYGLPDTARRLQNDRPDWAVPFGIGDHAVVIKTFQL